MDLTGRMARQSRGENGGYKRDYWMLLETAGTLLWCREGESNPHGVATGGF